MHQKFETMDIFPYPKFIQTINYFFPKKEGAIDLFSRENLQKLAKFAPYLGFVIILIMAISFLRSCLMFAPRESPDHIIIKFYLYSFLDLFLTISALFQYGRWLCYALLAKIAKRDTSVPLVISFLMPLRLLWGLCVLHCMIFSAIWLYSLAI